MDKEFKCIVLIDEQDVLDQDPPFLNRFEKQLLKFEDEIKDDDKKVARDIDEELETLLTPQHSKQKKPLLGLNKIIFNYQIEEIYALIYKSTGNFNLENQTDKNLENLNLININLRHTV